MFDVKDFVFAVAVCIMGVYVALAAQHFPEEAGGFPIRVAGATSLLALVQVITLLRRRRKTAKTARIQANIRQRGVIITAVILYPVGIFLVGFYPMTIAMIPAVAYFLGIKKIGIVILTTVVVTMTVYFAFTLMLQLQMPKGILLGGI